MKTVLQIASVLLQAFYILALFILASGLFVVSANFSSGDPKLISGMISQTIVSSLLNTIPAFVGLLISWRILVSNCSIPRWYRFAIKLLSYAWLIFIPFGTLLGFVQLRLFNRNLKHTN